MMIMFSKDKKVPVSLLTLIGFTMALCFLLVSMLLSDLCPLRHNAWDVGHLRCRLWKKRPHGGHRTLSFRSHCLFFWNKPVCGAMHNIQTSFPLHKACAPHEGHQKNLSHHNSRGKYIKNNDPAQIICIVKGYTHDALIPAFLVRPDVTVSAVVLAFRARSVIVETEDKHITKDKSQSMLIEGHYQMQPVYSHQEKYKRQASVNTYRRQKMLSAPFIKKLILNIKKEQKEANTEPQWRLTEIRTHLKETSAHRNYDGHSQNSLPMSNLEKQKSQITWFQKSSGDLVKQQLKSTSLLLKGGFTVLKPLLWESPERIDSKKSFIKPLVLLTEARTKRKMSAAIKNIPTSGQATIHTQAKEPDNPPLKRAVSKKVILIGPSYSKSGGIKVRPITLQSRARNINQEGPAGMFAKDTSASNSMRDLTKAWKKTQQTQSDNNMRNKTNDKMTLPDPVTTSPPSQKIKETAANLEIKHTASIMTAFDSEWQKDSQLQTTTTTALKTDNEQRFRTSQAIYTTQSKTQRPMSGLRMREDTPADTTKTVEDEQRVLTNIGVRIAPSWEPTVSKQGADKTIADSIVPFCRGLIHQTEAGLTHCIERLAKHNSPYLKFMHVPVDSRQTHSPPPKDNDDNNSNHFYYFDGVLKRVQNNVYPQN